MLSLDTLNRLKYALANPQAADEINLLLGYAFPGEVFCVDTVNGSDTNPGTSWAEPFDTMEECFDHLTKDQSVILVRGDVREQIVAPLGIQGVAIIGAAVGNTRHDDGVRWREEATAANAPLLELREQGWEIHDILMVPESGYSCVKLHREETATYPDASHFIARRVKCIGGGTRVGYGIEDYGGAHHCILDDCDFDNLEFGWAQTNVSIAAPLRNRIVRSRFRGNKHDITMNANQCWIGGLPSEGNIFSTVYDGTTHPNTVNLAYTADASGTNMVLENYFADAAADVTVAKGYKPSTGDVWRNKVSNTAADIVTVPT